MVFSRYIWTTILFVAVIVATAVLLGIFLPHGDQPVTSSLLILILALETAGLIYYLTRIRRVLLRLILSLRNEDASMQFDSSIKDPYFKAIHDGFNEVIRDFRLVRIDQEARQHFFEETVNHIQFGIMAFDGNKDILLVNRSLLQLLKLKELTSLNELSQTYPELYEHLEHSEHGRESLIALPSSRGMLHLIILSSSFVLRGDQLTLVSLRDISREMDQKELEAWQKLLRVLRHEVLNSLSPIQLIAGNLGQRPELKKEEWEEVREGLQTIHKRAGGLSRFLDAYSSLYRTPEPDLARTQVKQLLEEVLRLHEDQSKERRVAMEIDCPEGLVHSLDQRLVEQVLINLVKNALEALDASAKGKILLRARLDKDALVVEISDNGPGIEPEDMESIFIPFFSTREKGAGIGLSFSQHVMRMHGGRITVHSEVGKFSVFRLLFPR